MAVVCKMQSAPIVFWSYLSSSEWQSLNDDYQKRLIEAARKIYAANKYQKWI